MSLTSSVIPQGATAYNSISSWIFGSRIKYGGFNFKAQAATPISQAEISFPLTMAVEGSRSFVSVSQYHEIMGNNEWVMRIQAAMTCAHW